MKSGYLMQSGEERLPADLPSSSARSQWKSLGSQFETQAFYDTRTPLGNGQTEGAPSRGPAEP